jgi:hypothetical protein
MLTRKTRLVKVVFVFCLAEEINGALRKGQSPYPPPPSQQATTLVSLEAPKILSIYFYLVSSKN